MIAFITRLNAALLSILILSIVSIGHAHAQDDDQAENNGADINGVTFTIGNVIINGHNPLDKKKTEKIIDGHLGEGQTIESLQSLAVELENELIESGYGLYRVIIPAQDLQDESVILLFVKNVVGQINVSGNRYFSVDNINRSLPELIQNESPNTHALSGSLAIANLNPAKRARVLFTPTSVPREFDVDIEVSDRNPLSYFTWIDNSGSENSGESRLGVGVRNSNLFDRDHELLLSYTTSPEETGDVSQFAVGYDIPLYKRDAKLSLFGIKSDIDAGTIAQTFDVNGQGDVYGFRYTRFLKKRGEYRHQFSAEVADKFFENNIDFLGADIGVDVRSRPLSLQYRGEKTNDSSKWSVFFGAYSNLSGGSRNSDIAYNESRLGADRSWSSYRLGGNYSRKFQSNWSFTGALQIQSTSDSLIAGEQFGIGGINSVPGFEERELTGDQGYLVNLQLWMPPIANRSHFYVVLGGGEIRRESVQSGELSSVDIWSAGLGYALRWDNFNLGLVYGYAVKGIDESVTGATLDGESKLHFNLSYTFNRNKK